MHGDRQSHKTSNVSLDRARSATDKETRKTQGTQFRRPRDRNPRGWIIGPRQTHANGASSRSGGDGERAIFEQGLTGSDVPGGGRHGRPEPEERSGVPARVRQGPSTIEDGVKITENYRYRASCKPSLTKLRVALLRTNASVQARCVDGGCRRGEKVSEPSVFCRGALALLGR